MSFYDGNDVINAEANGTEAGTNSPTFCSWECARKKECKQFTWWGNTKQCWFFSKLKSTGTDMAASFSGIPQTRGKDLATRSSH